MKNMIKWTNVAAFGALVILLFAAYKVVDQAIFIDDLQSEVRRLRNEQQVLLRLANDVALKEVQDPSEAIHRQFGETHLIKQDRPDLIYVGQVGVQMARGKIAAFTLMNSSQ